ncbi:MAG: hypothetical protein QME88_00435 [Actinomycetota bacterium]|nr:hypothetical protein [Actinomycetota bacterium]
MLLYRFLLHSYVDDFLRRQLMGLSRTLGTASALVAYLAALCLPPFLLGRRDPLHPVWGGLECLSVYAVVAVSVGWLCVAFANDGWRILGALVAGGEAWAAAGSALLLAGAFLGAGVAGSKGASARGMVSRRRNKIAGR